LQRISVQYDLPPPHSLIC